MYQRFFLSSPTGIEIRKIWQRCVISGFRREGDESCVLLGCSAANSGNSLRTFRGTLPVPPSRVLEDGTEKFVPKRRYEITTIRYVITQNSRVLAEMCFKNSTRLS